MVSLLFGAGNKPTHCLQGDPISILQADTRCADMRETPRELPSNNTLVNLKEWQWGGVLLHKEETGSKTRKKTDPRGTKRSTTHPNLGYHPNCRYMKSLSGSPVNFVLYLLGVPDIVFAPEWTVLMPSSGSYFHLGTCSLKPTCLKKVSRVKISLWDHLSAWTMSDEDHELLSQMSWLLLAWACRVPDLDDFAPKWSVAPL